jgi:glycosyltransferase involved in cell wall biosynthesis
MLSILLPTYNYNITKLVTDLHQQALEQYVDFEIIVMEDGSTLCKDENKTVSDLKFCQYIVLPQNIGRSAIRNKLADVAKHDHLLFMDCDSELISKNFIQYYLAFCKEDTVVIGGTAYDPKEHNPNYSLRLKYGRLREARAAQERGKNNFSTFNFLISKSIFNHVRFDETIQGYGHEDMLFGHQLHQLGYEFIQIENPVTHKGLDDNRTFIRKTEEGTRNLYLLYQTGRYPYLAEESKLLATFLRIKKLGLTRLFSLKFFLAKRFMQKFLCCKNPSLLVYDFYKILFICSTSLTK